MPQPKDAIMVNGMMLGEYLRDNESIEEEVKSKEFIRQGFDGVYLNRHIKEKYKPHKEKNGKVIHLGQHEINKAEYLPLLKNAIKQNNRRNCLIILLMVNGNDNYLTIDKILSRIMMVGGDMAIRIDRMSFRYGLRSALGFVKKSELNENMIFQLKHTPENNSNLTKFKLKPGTELSLKAAIEKGNRLLPGYNYGYKKKIVSDEIPPQVQPAPAKAESNAIDIKPLDDNKLIESIVSNLQKLSTGNGALFNFSGDLVINININK